jgi:hypothetical protein
MTATQVAKDRRSSDRKDAVLAALRAAEVRAPVRNRARALVTRWSRRSGERGR